MRPAALVALLLVLAGCATRGEDVTASTPADPVAAARTALESAGLRLPDGATDVTVDVSGYGEFRNVARIAFTAPRAEAVAVCERTGGRLKKIFSLADYEKDLLGGGPAQGDQLCSTTGEFGRGVSAHMLVPQDDPARVRAAVFELPAR